MKELHEGDYSVYQCERCGKIFLNEYFSSHEHERYCTGRAIPAVYKVYAWLDSDKNIEFTIQTVSEHPIPKDKVQAVIIGQGDKNLLFYDDDEGDYHPSDVVSTPVVFEDIPAAIAAVQKLFLDKLMELAERLSEMPDEIGKAINLIKRLQ